MWFLSKKNGKKNVHSHEWETVLIECAEIDPLRRHPKAKTSSSRNSPSMQLHRNSDIVSISYGIWRTHYTKCVVCDKRERVDTVLELPMGSASWENSGLLPGDEGYGEPLWRKRLKELDNED